MFDDKNSLLLQQRSFKKKVYPGIWTLTAGHITFGDSPEETAHRELSEELGFDTKLIFIEKELVTLPNERFFAYRYLAKYNNEKIIFEPEEVENITFADKDQVEILVGKRKFNELENYDYKLFLRFFEGKYDHFKDQL